MKRLDLTDRESLIPPISEEEEKRTKVWERKRYGDKYCERCGSSGTVMVERDGRQFAEQCECRQRGNLERRLATIPERFRKLTLENFKPWSRDQERVLEQMRSNPHGSFLLIGPNDSGKTALLAAQVHSLILKGYPARFVSMKALAESLRALANDRNPDEDEEGFDPWQFSRHGGHLALDDAHAAAQTDFQQMELLNLINRHYNKQRGLSVTTNCDLNELQERLDPAIVSRLYREHPENVIRLTQVVLTARLAARQGRLRLVR